MESEIYGRSSRRINPLVLPFPRRSHSLELFFNCSFLQLSPFLSWWETRCPISLEVSQTIVRVTKHPVWQEILTWLFWEVQALAKYLGFLFLPDHISWYGRKVGPRLNTYLKKYLAGSSQVTTQIRNASKLSCNETKKSCQLHCTCTA